MIAAVIFDMDGLLIDSEPFWRAAHVAALQPHGVQISEDDVRAMAGRRTDEVVHHWRTTRGLEHIDGKTLEAEVVEQVIASIRAHGAELPGVRHAISLFEAHEVPMAVASSSAPEIIDAVLDHLSLAKHMRLAYSAKYEEFGKPHPAVFITTAQKLGVPPADCLVFEDSLNGVLAAKAAGMRCAAIPEESNRAKPQFAIADRVLSSLEELTWPMVEALFAPPLAQK